MKDYTSFAECGLMKSQAKGKQNTIGPFDECGLMKL